MEAKLKKNGTELTVSVSGKLDTTTAPALSKALDGALDGVERLVFNFKNLAYISSAGLSTMLAAMQNLPEQGETVVKDAPKNVLEVFEITGLINDLKIE